MDREVEAGERADQGEGGDADRALDRLDHAGHGQVRLGQFIGGLGRGRPIRDLVDRLELQQGDARHELGQRWVLRPVVLAEQDPGIPGAQALGIELAGAQVVVLVEVDRQPVHGEEPELEREEHHDGRADPSRKTQWRGPRKAGDHRLLLR